MARTDIGRRLRERRRLLGLTQEETARKAGVPLNSVARIERGEVRDPHLSMLSGIAEALDMSISELIGEPVVPLGEAPEAGEWRAKSVWDEEAEERIPTFSPEVLKQHIEALEAVRAKRDLEIKVVKQKRVALAGWVLDMEAADVGYESMFKDVTRYCDAVEKRERSVLLEVPELCEEFSRLLSNLKSLTRQARRVVDRTDVVIYVQTEKVEAQFKEFLETGEKASQEEQAHVHEDA
jgi:transcriptional regulator with XRE-family HTH domain